MAQRANESIVTGLFRDRAGAECAYGALRERGYSKDDVDVVMSEETRAQLFNGGERVETELGTKALEGLGAGSAIGGTAGAIIGALVAVGVSITIPGLGLLVAGPIAGALVGAGAGGLTGGLIGALIGYGIPEKHARAYEAGIKEGGIFLSVRAGRAEAAAPPAEEQSRAEDRPPARPVAGVNLEAFTEGTIEISEIAEVPVVEKQARVVEEVVVAKDIRERTETVRDTVRGTDVEVERIGDGGGGAYDVYEADFRENFHTAFAGTGRRYETFAPAYRYGFDLAHDRRYTSARDWSEVEAGARRDWESRGAGAWEDFKDSVRYAWERVRGRARGAARA